MTKVTTIVGLGGLLATLSRIAVAITIHVPADQPTIQAGIDAATSGDTVLVADGTYTGQGNRDIDFGGKAVVLISENGPELTIIDCEGDSLNSHRGFYFHSGEDFMTVVQGFTIRGGYVFVNDVTVTYGGGVLCESSSPTIVDCIIDGNFAMMGGGLSCQGSSPRLIGCTIIGNRAYLFGGGMYGDSSSPELTGCLFEADSSRHSGSGIYLENNSSPSITDCVFLANVCYSGGVGAIYCIWNSSPTLVNCLFMRNTGHSSYALTVCQSSSPSLSNCTFIDGGINCCYSSSPTLENCIIAFSAGKAVSCYVDAQRPCYPTLNCSNVYGNAGGDWVDCIAGQAGVNDNISLDPLFCDTAAGDYYIDALSPCAPALSDCGTLIGALDVGCGSGARVWYVKADGTGDAPTIQAAIDSSTTYDTVLVAPGTYTGEGNRDIELRGKRIILTSEVGPEQTVIDCGGSATEEHRGFYLHEGEDSTSLIEGLSIINGYMDSTSGGAMLCVGSSPTVRNCIFRHNYAHTGGAIACRALASFLRLEDCSLDSNTSGDNGGAIFAGSGIYLMNCVLTRNSATANGGAIQFYGTDTSMYSSDTSFLISCVFDRNHAGSNGGALYMGNASPYSTNCTFYGNTNNYGGTITIASYSSPVFDRCLLAFNDGQKAVACLSPFTNPFFTGSDIYGNAGGDWVDCIANQVGVYCNFSADPWFCDTAAGDLHLFDNSPCAPENNICNSLIGALDVGCSGTKTIIEPDLMSFSYNKANDSEIATVHLGNFTDGHTAGDIEPLSMLVNATITPSSWSVLPAHPDFEGEVMQITFPISDFLAGYGVLFDTTVQVHTVSGQFSDMDSFSVDGTVTIIGYTYGDVNHDGALNVADLTCLVDYLFRDGPPPPVPETANIDCEDGINVADLTYLVDYLFLGGPEPVCAPIE